MKHKTRYFKIGLFVLICLGLLIGGLIFLGSDVLFRDVLYLETYLNESVQGLEVGSSLLHRGVKIGRIKEITFVPSEYIRDINSPQMHYYGRYVMIILSVDLKHFSESPNRKLEFPRWLTRQIDAGLRLKLSYQGITGLAFLETEYVDPGRYPPMDLPWHPRFMYVPSMPSLIRNFTQAVDSLFQRLEAMDLEILLKDTSETLNTLEQTLVTLEARLQRINVDEMQLAALELIDQVRITLVAIEDVFQPDRLDLAFSNVPDALHQLSSTFATVEGVLDRHDDRFGAILSDVEVLIESMRELFERLKDDPAQILLSSPSGRSEVVQ